MGVLVVARSITVTLKANVTGWLGSMKAASKAMKDVADAGEEANRRSSSYLRDLHQAGKLQSEQWRAMGTSAVTFGAAVTAGLGAAAKAAVDWESAFAGVRKTVDASEEQYGVLENQLRSMAGTVSASHEEIASVAEAAGQLGIARENIASFTRTMIDLGESTNLSAEDAATSLARFSNIMGTAQNKFSNLGSAVVYLGNSYATTEREIVEMAMRLAGAGRNVEMSEGQVLGLATALSSVGIEAEAGGTAFSRVMVSLRAAVDEGGESLDAFARVAGMSSDSYAKLFKTDSGEALAAFVRGLSEVEKQGGSVNEVLSEMGFKDVRVADALRRSSAAADLFSKAMKDGEKAFDDNKALATEAAQRYETTASKIQMAWNQIKNAAIDLGAVLLPVIGSVSEAVSGIAQAFSALPQPVQASIASFLAMAAAGALLVGGLMKLATFASTSITQMQGLGLVSEVTAGRIGKVGKVIGGLAKKGIIAGIIKEVSDLGYNFVTTNRSASELQGGLNRLKSTGLKELFSDAPQITSGLISYKDAIERLNDKSMFSNIEWGLSKFASGVTGLVGIDSRSDILAFADQLKEVDEHLSKLGASGSLDFAQKGFKDLAESMDLTEAQTLNLLNAMPEYKKQLEDQLMLAGKQVDNQSLLELAMGKTADATEVQRTALEEVNFELEEQAATLREVIELNEKYAGIYVNETESQIRFIEAIEKANAAIQKNGANLDINTKAGRENQRALNDIATEGWNVVKSMEAAGQPVGELQKKMGEVRQNFINVATAMGMPADAATALADKLRLIPSEVEIETKVEDRQARKELAALQSEADKLEGSDPHITPRTLKEAAYADLISVTDAAVKLAKQKPVIEVGAKTDGAQSRLTAISNQSFSIANTPVVVRLDLTDNFTNKAWNAYNSIPRVKTIQVIAQQINAAAGAGAFFGSRHATGGAVRGLGTATSDSIPALLSDGEHVLTAREVRDLGGQGAVYRLRAMIGSGLVKSRLALAGGGAADYAPRPLIAPPSYAVQGNQQVSVSLSGQKVSLVLDNGKEFTAHIRGLADEQIVAATRVIGGKR